MLSYKFLFLITYLYVKLLTFEYNRSMNKYAIKSAQLIYVSPFVSLLNYLRLSLGKLFAIVRNYHLV